jgi:tetratricopeptide (TPR) repeat protein
MPTSRFTGARVDPGRRKRRPLHALVLGAAGAWCWAAPAFAADTALPERSALDAPLLYQILLGELELSSGRASQAFEVLFDAARRTRDENLFKRAVQVALQSRSVDHVQSAITAWRRALPQSLDAIRYQLQVAVATNRPSDAAEAFSTLLERTPNEDRAALIEAVPTLVERMSDQRRTAQAFEPALASAAQAQGTRVVAMVTTGRLWLAAGDAARAATTAEQAHAADPASTAPVVLALESMSRAPAAEAVVKSYLDKPGAEPSVRLGYGQALAQAQRHREALVVLERAVADRPESPSAWLTIGALHLEAKQPKEAEAALQRYLSLAQPAEAASDPDGQMRAAGAAAARTQVHLMLAQAAEQRGDSAAAATWLDKIDAEDARAFDARLRRASLLARQGKVAEARALIASAPEQTADESRAKVLGESQMLRDFKRWQDAYDVLAEGTKRFPQDVDMRYEQAMMAEKIDRLDLMESLLRQVIADKPDHQHAYNALGYSLADRGQRLDEARQLVAKALELAPGDPFITDSLGWIEFRLGNHTEAVRLLRQAWATRPDTEIGAHLGEALWVSGQQDEARRIWREARTRDAENDVLRETLKRLRVEP